MATRLATDTFTRTVGSGWGTADAGGAWTNNSSADHTVASNVGRQTLSAANISRLARLTAVPALDQDIKVRVATDKLAVGGPIFCYLVARAVDGSNYYRTAVTFRSSDQTLRVRFQRVIGGAVTDIVADTTVPGTHAAGTYYWLRMQAEGESPTTIRFKVWQDGTSEPSGWQIEQTDSNSTLAVASGYGVRSITSSSATNIPVVVSWDDFTMDGTAGEPIVTDRFAVVSGASTLYLPYVASASIGSGSQARAVVVVHGILRNAADYLSYAQTAAATAGSSALLVAPQFPISTDTLQTDDLYWTKEGWSGGSLSRDTEYARPFRISSFGVLDQLVSQLANRTNFPNLRNIVLLGHSGGGQLIQRYAAVGQPTIPSGTTVTYMPANPSSYVYLDALRWKSGTFSALTAQEQADAPLWDTWRHGLGGNLANDNSYANSVGVATIRSQYQTRKVHYMLGANDTNTDDPDLSVSPASMWQGSQRRERGERYYDHLAAHYGSAPSSHAKVIVAGVGHSGNGIINSPEASPLLFGVPGGEPLARVPRYGFTDSGVGLV